MLSEEIQTAQKLVRTDAYQMSVGEIVSMYEEGDLIIDPEFQRLFRWNSTQKSRLIESLLMSIPIPSIFVFETSDGKWELIDGLQRTSTILEFMGKLRSPDDTLESPSVLEATKYLPSLHNAVWERSAEIVDLNLAEQSPLGKTEQLAIRRARLGVEILKRPSEDQTKFDLFQRLNAGGTVANAQELRNCVLIMVNAPYFRALKMLAEETTFRETLNINDEQEERQRHMEYLGRFLVHANVPYDGKLDVEEYIDEGVIKLATVGDTDAATSITQSTFNLLAQAKGRNALRRQEGAQYLGKVGLVGLEAIAVGIARNILAIQALADPVAFVAKRIDEFWVNPEINRFTSPGLRGTTRIQRTVPFGEGWFRP